MILTDAGPLLALVDTRDGRHRDCQAALNRLNPPMVSLMPAFSEAMFLARNRAGWGAQEGLWRMLRMGAVVLRELDASDLERSYTLMRQYRDLPMDFADATLVAYAERHDLHEIFTLDRRDFSVYRLRAHTRFAIVP